MLSESLTYKSTIYLSDLTCEREKWVCWESHLLIIHSKFSCTPCCLFSFLALIHILPCSILHLLSLLRWMWALIIDWHLGKPEDRYQIVILPHKLEVTKVEIFPNMSESSKKKIWLFHALNDWRMAKLLLSNLKKNQTKNSMINFDSKKLIHSEGYRALEIKGV